LKKTVMSYCGLMVLLMSQSLCLALGEEKKVKDFYLEIGLGYPVAHFHSAKMEDTIEKNGWQQSFLRLNIFAGYYRPGTNIKWLFGIEGAAFYYQYSQEDQDDTSMAFGRYSGLLTSKYYLFGEIGDGLFLTDKIGITAMRITRSGGEKNGDSGLSFGFTLGAGLGYAYQLTQNFSLTFNLLLGWDSLGAASSDGYNLDSKSIQVWAGILF